MGGNGSGGGIYGSRMMDW